MKKNVLFVYPKFPVNYWSFSYSLPFINKKSSMPPLGAITAAAHLPKDYKIKLVDLNIEKLTDKDIKWADLVMLSSMKVQDNYLDDVVTRVKTFNKPIVSGGPHPTQYYSEMKGIDHFLLGEAESGTIETFIRDFERGNPKKAYARFTIRRNPEGKLIDEKEFIRLKDFFGRNSDIKLGERPSMDISPKPRYDLLKMDKYNSMAVQFSRGCPHNCDFCNEGALYGHVPRLKPNENFVDELKTIYDQGFRGSLFIVDDNFIANRKRVKSVLKKITGFQKERNYPYGIFTEVDITFAKDNELLELSRDAGINMVFTGLESPDDEMLKNMGKKQNIDVDYVKAVNTIQSYGIEVSAGFIVGNDNEPSDICDKIFDLRQKSGIPMAMGGLLTALRGSPLYEKLLSKGRILEESSGSNTHFFGQNFSPIGVNYDETIINYKTLLEKLYGGNLKNYYNSCLTLFKNLGYNPKPVRDVTKTEVSAFLKTLVKQTFSKHGIQYLKFIKKSFFEHKKHFPEAIRLSVMGYHFNKITQYSLNADNLQFNLNEKLDQYRKHFDSILKEKMEYTKISFSKLSNEKNKFLINMDKKIKKMPEDYRVNLMKTYENVSTKIDNLFKQNNLI